MTGFVFYFLVYVRYGFILSHSSIFFIIVKIYHWYLSFYHFLSIEREKNTECIYSFEIQPKLNENHQRKSIESLEATYTDSLYTQKGILVVKDIRPFRPALVQVKNMFDLEPENYISSLSEVYCVA